MFIFLMHAVVQCPSIHFGASLKLLLYQHFMIYFICVHFTKYFKTL